MGIPAWVKNARMEFRVPTLLNKTILRNDYDISNEGWLSFISSKAAHGGGTLQFVLEMIYEGILMHTYIYGNIYLGIVIRY